MEFFSYTSEHGLEKRKKNPISTVKRLAEVSNLMSRSDTGLSQSILEWLSCFRYLKLDSMQHSTKRQIVLSWRPLIAKFGSSFSFLSMWSQKTAKCEISFIPSQISQSGIIVIYVDFDAWNNSLACIHHGNCNDRWELLSPKLQFVFCENPVGFLLWRLGSSDFWLGESLLGVTLSPCDISSKTNSLVLSVLRANVGIYRESQISSRENK